MRDEQREDEGQETAESAPEETTETPPWEEIEPGRYQPRRTRGSCRGRELG